MFRFCYSKKYIWQKGYVQIGDRPHLDKHTRFILEKMLRHGFVGGQHTHIDNIPKGKPRNEYKEIMKEVHALRKKGYFIVKPKPDGLHISLDPRKLREIEEQLDIL